MRSIASTLCLYNDLGWSRPGLAREEIDNARSVFYARTIGVVVKLTPVTSRQSFALSAVVTDVHDVERLKAFTKIAVNDAGKFGTILTVDRFEGRLTWHVSVTALSDQFRPILWEELKPSQREAVRQLARELLDDVGRPDSDFEDVQDKSYQIVRQLTIERLVGKPATS